VLLQRRQIGFSSPHFTRRVLHVLQPRRDFSGPNPIPLAFGFEFGGVRDRERDLYVSGGLGVIFVA
jgi:hypothetical protein